MPRGVEPRRNVQLSSFSGGENKYPLDNSIDVGYGVNPPTKYPEGYNAYFKNQRDEELQLYVTDIELSLTMGGETVQSKNVRQFFPSNLVQPSIEIMGIAPNSYHMNNLSSFVRKSQDLAIFGGQEESNKFVEFRLFNSSIGTSDVDAFPYRGNRSNGKQITKGRHRRLHLEGYIQSVQAGARKENHAPEWQITMMIANMIQGPWEDQVVASGTLESWMDIFYGLTNKQKKKIFVQQETRKAPAQRPAAEEEEPPRDLEDIIENPFGIFGSQ
jgi:hypothetical protein